MSRVRLDRPWLTFDLGAKMQVLSWAINRPGFVSARQIIWREVRNADLPENLDVANWFDNELKAHGLEQSVAFLTSRDVSWFIDRTVTIGSVTAQSVVTVGLSNAERVGQRIDREGTDWGTINIAVRLNVGLGQAGLIETLSIATQARTAAMIDLALPVVGGIATGTGTDCIAVAAPDGPECFAGLHTDIGEAVGKAVYDAVLHGGRQWMSQMGKTNL
jgi:adenosylcobinamide amidohydrolase